MTTHCFGNTCKSWCPLAAQMLGWRPAEFWSATPAELALALSTPAGGDATGPSREWIDDMMERETHG